MVYSVQCAAAAPPLDHAHVQVKMVLLSHGPSHRAEQRKAASTPPAQKYPAASVSLFLPVCLKKKKKHNFINTDS